MSFYGSPGTSTNPDAGSQHPSPLLEQTWSIPNNSSAPAVQNPPPVHQHASSSDYHEPHGHYTELLPANVGHPILGGEWAPQSPSDPLLIPTTFSLSCSLPVLSPSYDTLTPSTPHLVASFLGTGHISGQQPIPSVPVEPSRQFGHGWEVGPGTSSSTLETQRWLDVQATSSVDPDWTSTAVGCVSPSGAEVWQGLSTGPPLPPPANRRRSTSRSPLNDTTITTAISPEEERVDSRRNAARLRSPKGRTRIPHPDASLPASGVRQQWATYESCGRSKECSVVAMEEEEAQNNSRDESLGHVESVNNSKSEITSVSTNIEKVCEEGSKQSVQVPSGK